MSRPVFDPRSILFVSPLSQRHLAKIPESGADVVQLDLGDAIPLPEMGAARHALRNVVTNLRGKGICSFIARINAPWLLAIAVLPNVPSSEARVFGLCRLWRAGGASGIQ